MAKNIARPITWGNRPPPFAPTGNALNLDQRPTHAVARDGRKGVKVDPAVLALLPPVSDPEAIVLDRVIAANRTGEGVRVASDLVAKLLGIPEHEAAAIVAGLRVKRLIVDHVDPIGLPDGVRPGPALTN